MTIDNRDEQKDKKLKDFNDLLLQLSDVDDKKKKLWFEIYDNAITDRDNAFIMFHKLVVITSDKSNEHAIHGRTMATYLERMSKANDQLIKLSELVAKSEILTNDDDDPTKQKNMMFDLISQKK